MKIVSINANGLRAYYNKQALSTLISECNPDVLCIQETKCTVDQVNDIFKEYPQYNIVASENKEKAGYAGVAIAYKPELSKYGYITTQVVDIDNDYYSTGRIVELYIGNTIIMCVYTLNSGSGKEDLRSHWNGLFSDYIENCVDSFNLIVCGDLNVVAGPNDYWSDFGSAIDSGPGLYEFEIKHFYELTKSYSLVDSFRELHPDERKYSWFNYRTGARKRNAGWRLDYFLVSRNLMNKVNDSNVLSEMDGSDHSPIELEIEL